MSYELFDGGATVIKKMIYLEESMGIALGRVAQTQNKSISKIIREAISDFFKKNPEIYNLAEYDHRMAEYLGQPSVAVRFRDVVDR
jgi:hypothetical protein